MKEVGSSPASARELAAVALVYAAVLLVLFSITGITPDEGGRGRDGVYYAAMAGDPDQPQARALVAPYCYRVLTPWLAALLPGNVVERFRVLHLVTWLGVLLFWHALARRTGACAKAALFGGIMLGTSAWGPQFAFYIPCYIDPLTLLFVVATLWAMVSNRAVWLALLIPLAMFQREQALIAWFAAAAHRADLRGFSVRSLAPCGALLAMCAAVLIGLRVVIQPQLVTAAPPWIVVPVVAGHMATDPRYLVLSILAIVYCLGVPLTIALASAAGRRFLGRRWVYYFLYASLFGLLSGSDKGRLAFLAAPVVVLACSHAINGWFHSRSGSAAVIALLAVHLNAQWPPWLVWYDGALGAPLIDTVEHGNHAASAIIPALRPIALSMVAMHLGVTMALILIVVVATRRWTPAARVPEVDRIDRNLDSAARPGSGLRRNDDGVSR